MSSPSPSQVRFVIGARWHDETNTLLRVRRSESTLDPVDLTAVRAPVDVVVDARNLTEALPDEPIVGFVDRLSNGLSSILSGERRKALVEFEEGPWELALYRRDHIVSLSIYEVAPPGRLLAADVAVGLEELVDTIDDALERMAELARELPASRAADELLEVVRVARGRLRVPRRPSPPVGRVPADQDTLRVETRGSSGFSVASELRVRGHAILDYVGEHPLDRHALLAPGRWTLQPDASTGLVLEGRPFAMYDTLVANLESLLGGEGPEGRRVRIISSGDLELWLSARRDGGRLELVREGVVAWSGEFPLAELVTLLTDHVVDAVAATVRLNPLLETNERLAELRALAGEVRRRAVRTIRVRPDMLALAASPELPELKAGPERSYGESFPFSPTAIQHMRYTRPFSLDRHRVDPRNLRRVGASEWLIATDELVERVDVAAGVTGWSEMVSGVSRLIDETVVSGAGAAGKADQVVVRDLSDGRARWTSDDLDGRMTDVVIARSESESIYVVATSSGRLCGVETDTGEERWSVPHGRPGAWRLVVTGDRVIAWSDEGSIVAVDPWSGRTSWRESIVDEECSVVRAGGQLLVTQATPTALSGAFGVLDPRSGRWRYRSAGAYDVMGSVVDGDRAVVLTAETDVWRAQVLSIAAGCVERAFTIPNPGGASTEPWWRRESRRPLLSISDGALLVCVGTSLVALELEGEPRERWRVDARSDEMRLVDACEIDGLCAVVSDVGVDLRSMEDGRLVHRIDAFWERLTWASVDERANLFALEVRGAGRTTLHSARAVGMLAPLPGGRRRGGGAR